MKSLNSKWIISNVLSIALILVSGCGNKAVQLGLPDEFAGEYATIKGVVAYKGKPVAGSRVHAYEVSEFYEEEKAGSSKIEEILRTQLKEEETVPAEWVGEGDDIYEDEERDDYPEYRGPSDYKSAPTDEDGEYSLTVAPGRYCLVARKRVNPEIEVGPLTPQDYSSVMSKPMTLEEGDVGKQDFQLENLVEQTIDFNTRYALKTKETEVHGIIMDENSHPVEGAYVTANKCVKVSHKPDLFSDPSDAKGEYTLYLPGGGVYYLELRRTPMGKTMPIKVVSDYINPADNSIEINEGELLDNVQIILIPQNKQD